MYVTARFKRSQGPASSRYSPNPHKTLSRVGVLGSPRLWAEHHASRCPCPSKAQHETNHEAHQEGGNHPIFLIQCFSPWRLVPLCTQVPREIFTQVPGRGVLGSCASPCSPSHLSSLCNAAGLITPPSLKEVG